MSILNLVGVQLDIAWENKEQNRKRLVELLVAAKPAADSLIVLPELFETGFSMNSLLASSELSMSKKFLCETSKRFSCSILAGLAVRDIDGRVENSAILFDEMGVEKGSYSKMHLFSFATENEHYIPGAKLVNFNVSGFELAPSICYDLRFPELYRKQVAAGAELFVVIANWPTQRVEHWKALLKARAIENQAFVFAVNRAGKDPANSYPGSSMLLDPYGNILIDAGSEECVIQHSIDRSKLVEYRKSFPVLNDLRL